MADEVVGLSLQLDPNNANQSVGSFRQQLKQAKEDLVSMQLQFGETSNEAANAAKKVALINDQLTKANELAAAFNPDKKFQALSSSVQSVAGGFSALTGAMALLGVQSDDVQKTLLKVQAALAISEGVNSILQGADAFKNLGAVIKSTTVFRKADTLATNIASGAMKLFGFSVDTTSVSFNVLKGAIAATGIGLLIVALGEAYSAFENFTSAAQRAADAQKEFNDSTLKFASAGLKADLENLDRQYKIYQARAKAQGESEEQLANAQRNYNSKRLDILKSYQQEVGDLDIEAADKIKEQEAQSQIDEYNQQAAQNQKLAELNKQRTEKAKAENLKRIADEKALQDELYKIHLQTQILSQQGIITQQQVQDDADAAAKEAKDKQDAADKDTFDKQMDYMSKHTSALYQSVQDEKAAADVKKSIWTSEQELHRAELQATADALGAFSALLGKNTLASKILGIAQATINTYLGVTEAIKQPSTLPSPFDIIAKVANVAIVLKTGLDAVKNIVKTPVPGGGGGSVPSSISSISTTAPLPAAKPVIQTNTTLDPSSINAVGNAAPPTRAFVLESDVTDNQERIARLNRAARLG